MSLHEFLLARIAEDERLARIVERSSVGASPTFRLVRECGAKRRIVDESQTAKFCERDALDYAVAILASVYADHPDYDEDWLA